MSKVLVISTSLRAKSNSDILVERLIAGAKDPGEANGKDIEKDEAYQFGKALK